jgi:hypothetical protein
VSYKAFAEFFVIAVTLAALIAHAFTAFRVLTLVGLAVVSFNAFSVFFTFAVMFAALIANVLAVLGVLALFPITFLDFRDTAINDRGSRRRLKGGDRRRCECECRQGKGKTKTY